VPKNSPEVGKCWCGQPVLSGAPLCKTHSDQAYNALKNIGDLVISKLAEQKGKKPR
jgi:hypothetical protein